MTALDRHRRSEGRSCRSTTASAATDERRRGAGASRCDRARRARSRPRRSPRRSGRLRAPDRAARRRARSSGDASRIDLHVGVREHHRADVAAFHHDAAVRGRIALLARDEHARTRGLRATAAAARVDLRRADRRASRRGRRSRTTPSPTSMRARVGERGDRRLVREIDALAHAPSTPPRGTSRRCRRGGSRAARRRARATVPLPAPDGPSMAMISACVTFDHGLSPRSRAMTAGTLHAIILAMRWPRTATLTLVAVGRWCSSRSASSRGDLRPRRRVRRAGRRARGRRRATSPSGGRQPVTERPVDDPVARRRAARPRATRLADRPAGHPARARRARRGHRRAAAGQLRARARGDRAIRSSPRS